MGRASRRKRERRLGPLSRAGVAPASASILEVDGVLPTRTHLLTRPLPPPSPAPPVFAVKISKALLDVVQPFLEVEDLSRDQVRSVVQFGALAWNLALLDEETRKVETEKIAREVTPGAPEESRAMIGVVLDRKARMHPRDRRFIVSVEVVDHGDSWRVLAAGVAAAD